MLELDGGQWKQVGEADLSRLHLGHPPGGAQDRFSSAAANLIAGNPAGTNALEFTLIPPRVTFLRPVHFVVGGAPCEVLLDGVSHPRWACHRAEAGSQLRLRLGATGCRIYLAVSGGIQFGDESLPKDLAPPPPVGIAKPPSQSWAPPPGELRILTAPESEAAITDALAGAAWTVSPQSSGMGLRLAGPELGLGTYDIVSSPVQDGTIQATRDGPIALLRDRGTLGGYPRIAQIIDPDVDRLAQLRPGDAVRLRPTTEAEAALAEQQQQDALRDVGGTAPV